MRANIRFLEVSGPARRNNTNTPTQGAVIRLEMPCCVEWARNNLPRAPRFDGTEAEPRSETSRQQSAIVRRPPTQPAIPPEREPISRGILLTPESPQAGNTS